MTTLHRLVVQWAGPQIEGAAVNVLHWDGSDNASPPVAAVLSAYDGLKSLLPTGVTLTIPGTGDSINDATGELTGVWAAAGGGTVGGTGPATAAAGVGVCVGWTTGGIVNGRKLRGRTFLVPVTTLAFEGDGTIGAGSLTQVGAFATAMLAAGPLAIWHRPTSAGASDGNSYGVQQARIRDKVAVLRSRRD